MIWLSQMGGTVEYPVDQENTEWKSKQLCSFSLTVLDSKGASCWMLDNLLFWVVGHSQQNSDMVIVF